jgi:hypothetical protein
MTPTLPLSGTDVASSAVEDAPIRARRATVDDLPALHALWQRAELPWDQLDRFVTEFLVVPGEEGILLAAIGLQIDGDQGLFHSEAILANDDADTYRAALWQRLQIVSRNQGAVRLWTLEDAPFWRSVFVPADPALINGMKTSFADPTAGWWTFQIIDPAKAQKLVDEQLALWEASREGSSSEFADTIQRFRQFSFLVVGVVITMMLMMVLYVLMRRPDALQQVIRGFGGR